MATSLSGGPETERALAAAPVPRPPQPTRATSMVLSSAAWTKGILMPASAETAAVEPAALRKARRELVGNGEGFMVREIGVEGRGVSMAGGWKKPAVILSGVPCGRRRDGTESKDL